MTALRQLPTPQTEPPFDESPGQPRARAGTTDPLVQGTLALAFVLPSGLPVEPTAPRLRLVPDVLAGARDDDTFGRQATPRAALPCPREWSGRFVQAVLEVVAGDRPAAQLVRWTDAEVYAWVQRRAAAGRGTRGSGERVGARPVIRSVRACEPADGVAEVCAVVQHGRRASAVALRLQGLDGRWQCTALQLR